MTQTPLKNMTVYSGYVIKTKYSTEEGYCWEVFKGKEQRGDSSKQYGEDTRKAALFRAKQHIDRLCDD